MLITTRSNILRKHTHKTYLEMLPSYTDVILQECQTLNANKTKNY